MDSVGGTSPFKKAADSFFARRQDRYRYHDLIVAGDFGPRALFPTRPRSPDRSHQRVQFAPANLDFHASSSR